MLQSCHEAKRLKAINVNLLYTVLNVPISNPTVSRRFDYEQLLQRATMPSILLVLRCTGHKK